MKQAAMIKTVGVIGLGLIGGSAARCLSRIFDVIGVDSDPHTLDLAVAAGVIREGYTEVSACLSECDLIYLALPVLEAQKVCAMLRGIVKAGTVVTDLCSTKAELTAYMEQFCPDICFVGGHPMAGSEKSGFDASAAYLFENAYYIVTPSKTSTDVAIELISQIAREQFGAIVLSMTAAEHDFAIGLISHLPHVAASALVRTVEQHDDSRRILQTLAAGGFRDITRIASSDPRMWQNICLSNRDGLRKLLRSYRDELDAFDALLERGDAHALLEYFCGSKQYRDEMNENVRGMIPKTYELIMDIEDKPGIIGRVATLLGAHGVNIKNIAISNSREFEGGILRIQLRDKKDYDMACALLPDTTRLA